MRQEQKKELAKLWVEKTNDDGETYYESEHTCETTVQRPIMPGCFYWIGHNDDTQLYHLLVKHAGSTVPSSWRQPVITRTKREAYILIKKYYIVITSKMRTFQQVARVVSDCPSAQFNGNVGVFRQPSLLHESMTAMILRMQVGVVFKPKDSPLGFHLLLRTK